MVLTGGRDGQIRRLRQLHSVDGNDGTEERRQSPATRWGRPPRCSACCVLPCLAVRSAVSLRSRQLHRGQTLEVCSRRAGEANRHSGSQAGRQAGGQSSSGSRSGAQCSVISLLAVRQSVSSSVRQSPGRCAPRGPHALVPDASTALQGSYMRIDCAQKALVLPARPALPTACSCACRASPVLDAVRTHASMHDRDKDPCACTPQLQTVGPTSPFPRPLSCRCHAVITSQR